MAEYKATWAHIVPPVAVQLANSDLAAKYDLSSLKTLLIAAAPTKKALQKRLKDRFGADTKIIQGKTTLLSAISTRYSHGTGYGMSECSPTVTLQSPLDDENNIGTIGKPVVGTYVPVS